MFILLLQGCSQQTPCPQDIDRCAIFDQEFSFFTSTNVPIPPPVTLALQTGTHSILLQAPQGRMNQNPIYCITQIKPAFTNQDIVARLRQGQDQLAEAEQNPCGPSKNQNAVQTFTCHPEQKCTLPQNLKEQGFHGGNAYVVVQETPDFYAYAPITLEDPDFAFNPPHRYPIVLSKDIQPLDGKVDIAFVKANHLAGFTNGFVIATSFTDTNNYPQVLLGYADQTIQPGASIIPTDIPFSSVRVNQGIIDFADESGMQSMWTVVCNQNYCQNTMNPSYKTTLIQKTTSEKILSNTLELPGNPKKLAVGKKHLWIATQSFGTEPTHELQAPLISYFTKPTGALTQFPVSLDNLIALEAVFLSPSVDLQQDSGILIASSKIVSYYPKPLDLPLVEDPRFKVINQEQKDLPILGVTVGDLNHDTYLDVVIAKGSFLYIWEQSPTAGFRLVNILPLPSNIGTIRSISIENNDFGTGNRIAVATHTDSNQNELLIYQHKPASL